MNQLTPNSILTSQGQDTKSNGLKPEFDYTKYGIGSITPAETLEHVTGIIKQTDETKESKGLFTVKTATRWIEQAKTRPIPKMLFGEFWFEGELCILFADTNLGKSILAVQIGNSISKGELIRGFKLEALRQPILYFDFELGQMGRKKNQCLRRRLFQNFSYGWASRPRIFLSYKTF